MNSAAMIFAKYKRPAKKVEAEKWFNVQPGRAANVIPLASGANK
jgi:hypothetical protein